MFKQLDHEKSFSYYNATFLLLLFLYAWSRQVILPGTSASSLIFSPGAYLFSVWILSPLVLYFFNVSRSLGRPAFLKKSSVLSLGFGLLHFLLTGLLILVLERFFRLPEHYSVANFDQYLFSYWLFAVEGVLWYWFYTAIFLFAFVRRRLKEEKEKVREMERELTASYLKQLTTELNPHFLFNSMNSIAMQVRLKENKQAVAMIASLNDLLRVVMSRRKEKMISLADEVQLLEKYLLIEKARFGTQVGVTLSFPEHLCRVSVPQLILQPLIENAFKHGIKDSMVKQHISVAAEEEDNCLVLRVFNTATPDYRVIAVTEGSGIGLSNIVHRLRKLYGTRFRFQSITLEKGIEFRIFLPFSNDS